LTNWVPSSISTLSYFQIKSVEKTLRLALIHLLRSGQVNAFASQINDCLHRQDQRMRLASDHERRRKEEESSLKRQRILEDVGGGYAAYTGYNQQQQQQAGPSSSIYGGAATPGQQDYANAAATKRRRLMDGMDIPATPPPSSSQAVAQSGLANFDIKTLKPELVLELIIANLQVMPPERVQTAVDVSRRLEADIPGL
jgi:symplekin